MSKTVIADVACPHCGGIDRMELWESINTVLNPEVRERMLQGRLFSHRCQACGRPFQVLYDCLYHDMERRFMAFFLPDRPEDPFAMLEDRVQEPLLAGYQTRIVHDVPSFIEKVRIREDGRDDRAIELCKYVLRCQMGCQEDGELRYLRAQEEGLQFYFRAGEKSGRFAAREELYQDVLDRAGDRLMALGECRRVDRAWADVAVADGILA
jgi:hypothetical protein